MHQNMVNDLAEAMKASDGKNGVFATHPGGMSIADDDLLDPLDLPLPLLLPLPFPFWSLVGGSSWSACCLLSGLGFPALGADFIGIGMRYGMSSGEVRSIVSSLSKGFVLALGNRIALWTM